LLERYILFFAVYEILVYITLSFINDARRDALLTLRSSFEQALLYIESGQDIIKESLLEVIERQLDSATFNQLDIRAEYEGLIQFMETQDLWAVKRKLGVINHHYETCNLQWKFTFLLRLLK